MMPKDIPKLFWLYLPIGFILVQIGMESFVPYKNLENMLSENGSHELLQAFISLCAFVMALSILPKINWATQSLVGIFVVVAAIGSLYITGEEISWGQHIVDWSTPEFWMGVNDQYETNLHNTSSWLDQKPRFLLFVGIVVAGLMVPFLRAKASHLLPLTFSPVYPSNILIPTSLGVLVPHMTQKIADVVFDVTFFLRVSEVQEIYLYYFVFLYLWDLRNREIS